MRSYNERFVVKPQMFDAERHIDADSWYKQGHERPDWLTRTVINIIDQDARKFPISAMQYNEAFGVGSPEMKSLNSNQYKFPVLERRYQNFVTAQAVTGNDIGLGNKPFKVCSTNGWVHRFSLLQSPRGYQVWITEEPNQKGDVFEYEVIYTGDPEQSIPASEFEAGIAWACIGNFVPEVENRSSFTSMSTWGEVRNQIGFMRKGITWGDTSSQKMMDVSIRVDDGKGNVTTTSGWLDYYMYQFECDFHEEKEHMYWYSRFNRGEFSDTISLKDTWNQQEIPMFGGIFDQILNSTTYTELTYEVLQNKVTDALDGIRDAENLHVYLYTGLGGMREIDRALKMELGAGNGLQPLLAGDVASKFVKDNPMSDRLMLDGFFDSFAHIDGYMIYVKFNPVFHLGRIAEAQKQSGYTHPRTGFPLESHRLVFLDTNPVEGMSNVQFPTKFGYDKPYTEGISAGLRNANDIPASLRGLLGPEGSKLMTEDTNKFSYTRLCPIGVQLLRANRCLDIECVLGA